MDKEFWKELENVYLAVIKYDMMKKEPLFQYIKIATDKVFGNAVIMHFGEEIVQPLRAIRIPIEIPATYVEKMDKRVAMGLISDHIDRAITDGVITLKNALCDSVRTICKIDNDDIDILVFLRQVVPNLDSAIELQQISDWVWSTPDATKQNDRNTYLRCLVKYCNFTLSKELIKEIKSHFIKADVKPEQATETARENDTIKLLTEAFAKLQSKCGDHFEWIEFGSVVEPMLTSYDLVECCNELLEEYKNNVQ